MKMGRNVDWAFGKPIAIARSLGAILGQCWMGLDGGQRWVLPPAASWAEEAEVDAAAAHCFLEG